MSNASVNEEFHQQELDELRRQLAEARAGQAAAEAREGELRRVLAKIEEGKGRYNRDPLEHCSNTVEDMKALAAAALNASAPPASDLLEEVEVIRTSFSYAREAFGNTLGEERAKHGAVAAYGEAVYRRLRRAIGLPPAPEGE